MNNFLNSHSTLGLSWKFKIHFFIFSGFQLDYVCQWQTYKAAYTHKSATILTGAQHNWKREDESKQLITELAFMIAKSYSTKLKHKKIRRKF